MRVASFFSGIGGCDLAFQRAGHEIVFSCEIDSFARKVYKSHFGKVTARDITKLDPLAIPAADIWVAGSPCQGFSSAGKRKGLDDNRSGLVLKLLELAKVAAPTWLLIENVPGLLSGVDYECGFCRRLYGSDDFEGDDPDDVALRCSCGGRVEKSREGSVPWLGTLLGAMAESHYDRVAGRVLDAQFVGVPQRRRRIFLLGRRSGTAGPSPGEVLLEPNGVRRRAQKGRKKGPRASARTEGSAGCGELYSSTGPGKWSGDPGTLTAHEAKEPHHLVAGTVQAHHGRGAPDDQLVGALQSSDGGADDNDAMQGRLVAAAVTASAGHHGHSSPRGDGSDNLIAATLTSGGHPNSNAPGRRKEDDVNLIAFDMAQVTHPENRARLEPGSPAPSLAATGAPHVAYGVAMRGREGGAGCELSPVAAALRDGSKGGASAGMVMALQNPGEAERGQNGAGVADPEGPMFTLESSRPHGIAFNWTKDSDGAGASTEVTSALGAHHTKQDAVMQPRAGVRRLLPIECERLQGLPDGWTAIPKASDSQRYRVVGNGVAIPVLFWIARKLAVVAEGRAVTNNWRGAYCG